MQKIHEILRHDGFTFVQRAHLAAHQTVLGGEMYLRVLAYDLERIVAGSITRYVCNLPPGHGKTFIFSVALTAWLLARKPSARVLIVSYGEDLATDISRTIRQIMAMPWYRDAFPKTKLAKNQLAARDFGTTEHGHVCARSIDGAVTGIRCDHLLVDDPVQIRDSGNIKRLDWVNQRFQTDLMTRLNNPLTDSVVVVHHRLHQRDLTGSLLQRPGWRHRALPFVAPEDRQYRLKNGRWVRKRGELLRPDAYTPDYVAELRELTDAPGFGPLYQQSFAGSDVLQIRREDFEIETMYAPPAVPYAISIDPNHKGEDGHSFGVIQCWALLPGGRYLLQDQWRGRANRSAFADQVRIMKGKYRPACILIEDNGPALDLQHQFESTACRVILVRPVDHKLTRLRRHLDLFQNRKIVLRDRAPFLEAFISEFEAFPYGESDDQVDAATQFFDWIGSNDVRGVIRPQPAMGALGNPRQARAMLDLNAGRPNSLRVLSALANAIDLKMPRLKALGHFCPVEIHLFLDAEPQKARLSRPPVKYPDRRRACLRCDKSRPRPVAEACLPGSEQRHSEAHQSQFQFGGALSEGGRQIYRFFLAAFALLPRPLFATTVAFDNSSRAAAVLVRREPG